MVNNTLNLHNLKKKDMIQMLANKKFKPIEDITKLKSTRKNNTEEDYNEVDQVSFKSYDYLLSMPFWNFSDEKINELKQQQKQLKNKLNELHKLTPE